MHLRDLDFKIKAHDLIILSECTFTSVWAALSPSGEPDERFNKKKKTNILFVFGSCGKL